MRDLTPTAVLRQALNAPYALRELSGRMRPGTTYVELQHELFICRRIVEHCEQTSHQVPWKVIERYDDLSQFLPVFDDLVQKTYRSRR